MISYLNNEIYDTQLLLANNLSKIEFDQLTESVKKKRKKKIEIKVFQKRKS